MGTFGVTFAGGISSYEKKMFESKPISCEDLRNPFQASGVAYFKAGPFKMSAAYSADYSFVGKENLGGNKNQSSFLLTTRPEQTSTVAASFDIKKSNVGTAYTYVSQDYNLLGGDQTRAATHYVGVNYSYKGSIFTYSVALMSPFSTTLCKDTNKKLTESHMRKVHFKGDTFKNPIGKWIFSAGISFKADFATEMPLGEI
jgi:hypothetical protein